MASTVGADEGAGQDVVRRDAKRKVTTAIVPDGPESRLA
jgi:hypothetical protein